VLEGVETGGDKRGERAGERDGGREGDRDTVGGSSSFCCAGRVGGRLDQRGKKTKKTTVLHREGGRAS
jgi:hypothetical protein